MFQLREKMTDENDKVKLRAEIDANLKRVYATLKDEEVPDRFRQLLEELRRKEEKK